MKLTGSTVTMITYLLVGLTAFCCSTIKGVEANELKLRAREKMRKDRAERQLQADNAGLVFSRGYVCITRQQDFAFVIPQQKSIVPEDLFDLNLLGSSTLQSGGIYDPADVQIVDRLGTSKADNFFGDTARGQFAGQRQPKFIPQKDPGFFFNGECVATQVRGALILGHSCLLNLCLGGGGYNCLAIYAGSKFVFNPLEQVVLSPSTFTNIPNNAGSIVPSLPPSYPGTIIGGTGLFVGAVGYVDVTTITGSTLTPASSVTETINENFPQAGYITQKINVVTNVPLPVAP
ncbi:hypothetical protein FRACYDRAFT_247973 [Fragilariopsis cylindrus CCMP1102]|uniref:Altered inheritance of mitochondria protein 24, mitochondrial n=1 Tax=Fragilariopsis cylindrus CCMP1102 TaxID=635003 RepID=A0A1E7EV41_9STRA|nr:hypothetical protein FRACYDRAFT_247973 [Fragilariopsis cylindrus CCMP1102]|eukprot:OEU09717.1 hypothetical protein FRACYDRAFT_247973 [Fragilariopsis cylindrus CCMP1102]